MKNKTFVDNIKFKCWIGYDLCRYLGVDYDVMFDNYFALLVTVRNPEGARTTLVHLRTSA